MACFGVSQFLKCQYKQPWDSGLLAVWEVRKWVKGIENLCGQRSWVREVSGWREKGKPYIGFELRPDFSWKIRDFLGKVGRNNGVAI